MNCVSGTQLKRPLTKPESHDLNQHENQIESK